MITWQYKTIITVKSDHMTRSCIYFHRVHFKNIKIKKVCMVYKCYLWPEVKFPVVTWFQNVYTSNNLDGNKNFIRWLKKYLSESENTAVKMYVNLWIKVFHEMWVEKNNDISVWVCVTLKCVPIITNYYNRHLSISHILLKIVYVVILSQRFLSFFFF